MAFRSSVYGPNSPSLLQHEMLADVSFGALTNNETRPHLFRRAVMEIPLGPIGVGNLAMY